MSSRASRGRRTSATSTRRSLLRTPRRIAADGHSALVEFEIRGDKTKAVDKVGPVLKSVAAAQRAHPSFFIGEFGDASGVKAVETAYGDDLGKAGTLSLPITLAILVLAFGALVAAGIPLLLALTAVFATFGLVALPSHLLPLAPQAYAMVLLIGLAVGVDYSMFYLKRERQERAAGRSGQAALEAAAATSGRSVLISGLTVMVAMAGMFLTGDATFASLGLATILVVAVAVLGSLTVLPALLSKLGDRVDRLRVPLVGRLRRDNGEGRVWGAIVDRVLRRPLLSALAAGALMLALAAPALQLHIATPGPDTFPKSLTVVKTYDRMQQAFPGTALPASVVVQAPNVNAPSVRRAIGRFEQRALASGRMYEPITVAVNTDATVANITVPIEGKGTDAASNESLAELRDVIIPATFGTLPNTEAGVTGLTAQWKDQADELKSKTPIVVAFVLLLAFALMLVAFRSLVIAVKAILLNLLSVAAAYGVLVLVFQHGFGKSLLGFSSTAGIDPVVPLLLFVILFGLSMDYHVFIISRIRETYDRGATTDEAISHGIKSTAGVVIERRAGNGQRVRDLRNALDVVLQAVRGRTRNGSPPRRHDRPCRASARDDEAAGRRELVPAALARVATASRAPGAAGLSGGGPDARLGVVPARIPAALRGGRDPMQLLCEAELSSVTCCPRCPRLPVPRTASSAECRNSLLVLPSSTPWEAVVARC